MFGQTTSPSSSVANEGFAPLCGAAAISMAALKTPVASEGGESRASVVPSSGEEGLGVVAKHPAVGADPRVCPNKDGSKTVCPNKDGSKTVCVLAILHRHHRILRKTSVPLRGDYFRHKISTK